MRPRLLRAEPLERRELLAALYYVSPSGSDSNAGAQAAPWRTLQKAANEVEAGDTVTVAAGTYVGFDLRTDGTAAEPITFRAQPGAVINQRNNRTPDGINLEGADYITIEGFTLLGLPRTGIRSVLNHHVTIRDNRADQNGRWGIFTGFSDDLLIEHNETSRSVDEHGIYASNSGDRPVIRGNTIWGNHGNGIHLNGDISQGGDGIISGALIENNVIYDNGRGGGSGINGDGLQSSTIRNNLLYDNHASGISLYQIDAAEGAKNNVVVNNTIIQASDGRWALNIQDASTGNRVYNNILYNYHSFRGSIDIDPAALPGFASDYNVVMNRFIGGSAGSVWSLATWRANTGQDQHSIVATPLQLFIDAAGDDYRLAPISPALDAGTATHAPSADLAGTPRPQSGEWDIGSYEFSQTDATPPEVLALWLRGSTWGPALPSVSVDPENESPTLPWVRIDTVEMTFSEDMVLSASTLDVTGDGIGDPAIHFDYDPATQTARWQFPQPLSGQIEITLAPGATDAAGNAVDFSGVALHVVPGDANNDGATTREDLMAIRDGLFAAVGQPRYNPRYDLDGDGMVNIADMVLARDNQESEPTASALETRRIKARRRIAAAEL